MNLPALLRRERPAQALRRVYDAWAQVYDLGPGDPIQRANDAALSLCVPAATPRAVAIDAGCGTGHHQILLSARGWDRVFGFDLSFQMLQRAQGYSGRAVAELHRLPIRPAELLLCSLVLTHVSPLEPALDALAKLVRYRGHLVLSLIHPRAIAAGLPNCCPGADRRWWRLPHRAHPVGRMVSALRKCGLAVELVTEPAPEPALPHEPARPLVPLVYAVCARRIVG